MELYVIEICSNSYFLSILCIHVIIDVEHMDVYEEVEKNLITVKDPFHCEGNPSYKPTAAVTHHEQGRLNLYIMTSYDIMHACMHCKKV